jgi:hypothetical protein
MVFKSIVLYAGILYIHMPEPGYYRHIINIGRCGRVIKKWLFLLFLVTLVFSGCSSEKKPQDIMPETIPGFIIYPLEVGGGGKFIKTSVYTEPGSKFNETVYFVYVVIEDCVSNIEAKEELSTFTNNDNIKEQVQVEGLTVIKGRQNHDTGDTPEIDVALVKDRYFVYCAVDEAIPIKTGEVSVDTETLVETMFQAGLEVMKAIIPNIPD